MTPAQRPRCRLNIIRVAGSTNKKMEVHHGDDSLAHLISPISIDELISSGSMRDHVMHEKSDIALIPGCGETP